MKACDSFVRNLGIIFQKIMGNDFKQSQYDHILSLEKFMDLKEWDWSLRDHSWKYIAVFQDRDENSIN